MWDLIHHLYSLIIGDHILSPLKLTTSSLSHSIIGGMTLVPYFLIWIGYDTIFKTTKEAKTTVGTTILQKDLLMV